LNRKKVPGVTDYRSGQPELFEAFVKATQYIAGLKTQQDIWEHLGRFIITYFPADWVAFAQRDSTNEISIHHCTLKETPDNSHFLTDEARALITDVLESGWLKLQDIGAPEPSTIAALPITEESRTEKVMLIGHQVSEPLPKDLLNIYLAIAGLAGATCERLRNERELNRHRAHLEELVKERAAELATTLRSIGDAVIATDREGRITFMNPVAEGLLGWKQPEVAGQKLTAIFNIINRQTRQPAENPVSRVLREGSTVGLANHTVLITRNGTEVPIDDSAAPIKDDQESISGVILVFRDITEREQAAKNIEHLASFPRLNPSPILEIDPGGLVTFYSSSALEALREAGFQEKDLEDSLRLFLPEDLNILLNVLRDEKEPKEFYREVTIGDRIFGESIHLPEQPRFLRIYAYDITERKQLESELRKHRDHLQELVAEALEKIGELNSDLSKRAKELANANQELESFNYSVSHDLRAPLRSINGFSQIIFDQYQDKLDEEGREYLQIITSECKRMGQLIDDLLNLSRLSRKEVSREEVDLSSMAETIAAGLRRREPDRQVDFVIASGVRAHGDRGLLQSVLGNLLSNAWKFTSKHDRARIEFGATMAAGYPGGCPDSEQTYFVRDDGAGFDMRYAHKLFGAFQRLHGMAEFPGNGIGLAITQRIVHHHGGKAWAESVVEQGATFYFTLGKQSEGGKQEP
jgi:PAS domain S-box-containing protein